MTYTPDMVVAKYVEIRDQLKVKQDAFASEIKPLQDSLETLESWLLNYLNTEKLETARTEAGTAYKNHVLSVQVEDWDRLLGTIISNALQRALAAVDNGGGEKDAASAFASSPELSYLIRGVSKTAVQEYMEAHAGQAPPGVKTTRLIKVGVRRA